MKNIIHRYQISKFKRIGEGLLFAFISGFALVLCLDSVNRSQSQVNILLTFCVAMISMLMGLASLFNKEEAIDKNA